MLEYLKDYYVFMLIFMVLSYLVPKEEYKTYIQFFIGIFLVVLFLEPVLELITMGKPDAVQEIFRELNERMEGMEYELGIFKGEGE